jgi:aminoglycoside 3'-phosphotransferase-3
MENKEMNDIKLPELIEIYTKGMTCSKDTIGCSNANIYCYSNSDNMFYLKVDPINNEFEREQNIMEWLKIRLPVPHIIANCREGGYDYLLMTKAIGEMAYSDKFLQSPNELVKLLALGINTLQRVDITDCPFEATLHYKLDNAKKRIENNEIDMSDWEENTLFKTPQELYDYLVENQPEEELVFSHGDYCLPNVFFNEGNVTGFIDLGRAGIADKWQDIALCVRSLAHNFNSNEYGDLLFKCLDIEPNLKKIEYYILLDELF